MLDCTPDQTQPENDFYDLPSLGFVPNMMDEYWKSRRRTLRVIKPGPVQAGTEFKIGGHVASYP